MQPLESYVSGLREDRVFDQVLVGRQFRFRTTWGLFSPREVDAGTRMLLQYIEINPDDDCLDLGCGYGAIGMALASLAPQGRTILADKDFVAIEYARKNILINELKNCEAILSNGFDQLGNLQLDVVAANIPAKVGRELLYIWLADAYRRLRPGGRLYVVTVTGLRVFFAKAMREVFGNYEKLKQGPHHTVAMTIKIDDASRSGRIKNDD